MRAAQLGADTARRAFIDAHRGQQPDGDGSAERGSGGAGGNAADGAGMLLGALELPEAVARLGDPYPIPSPSPSHYS